MWTFIEQRRQLTGTRLSVCEYARIVALDGVVEQGGSNGVVNILL